MADLVPSHFPKEICHNIIEDDKTEPGSFRKTVNRSVEWLLLATVHTSLLVLAGVSSTQVH
jgi:hypothetical protein